MVKETPKPNAVLDPGAGPNSPTETRCGLLIPVDPRVIQIIRGIGAGQTRDETAVLDELRKYAFRQIAARKSKEHPS